MNKLASLVAGTAAKGSEQIFIVIVADPQRK